jgi:hypothetical protein
MIPNTFGDNVYAPYGSDTAGYPSDIRFLFMNYTTNIVSG